MLIDSLKVNDKFTIKSYCDFYDIFVWQIAGKKAQIEFVSRMMMRDSKERSIVEVGEIIDLICRKINIDQFNKSLNDFNEVVKKLIFGDDYENSDKKEYYMTRKALHESLEGNEECISIFINIYYAS